MRGITSWNYKPFRRLHEQEQGELPFICRIAPFEKGITLDWFDKNYQGEYDLYYRKYKTMDPWQQKPVHGESATIDNLDDQQDYEFYIQRKKAEGKSATRLARTGWVPGVIVNYLHPEDPIYHFSGHSLCSPTLVRLPSGALISAMDVFAGAHGNSKLTLIFKSFDDGKSWKYVTDIYPSFWPKLFMHKDVLYLFAGSHDYGDMLIGCSKDEGETWSAPVRLIPGCGPFEMGPHKAPMPVISHQGRLYTAIDYGAWRYQEHRNGLLSISEDGDLMDPGQWEFTPFLQYDSAWPNAPVGSCPGCIEGNAVVSPEGIISNYLRIDHPKAVPNHGKAVVLKGNNQDPQGPLTLDRIVDCPVGSNSKFQPSQDPVTKQYIDVGTEQGPQTPGRTVLSMAVSDDFYTWRIAKRILDYRNEDPKFIGFQYPDWIFDGDDILLLSRTAFGRPYNFHDANYQTFHRIENFRQYL